MADELRDTGGGKRAKTGDDENVVSITVRIPGAPALTARFRVERTTKLSEVFDAHAVRIDVNAHTMRFYFNGERVGGDQCVEQLGAKEDESALECFCEPEAVLAGDYTAVAALPTTATTAVYPGGLTLAQYLAPPVGCFEQQPSHWAAEGGQEDDLRALHKLGAGASLSAGDADGKTPAHCAAIEGHEGCLRVLHELGAGVGLSATTVLGITPVHCAVWGGAFRVRAGAARTGSGGESVGGR
jgi:hypothetical protein